MGIVGVVLGQLGRGGAEGVDGEEVVNDVILGEG